MTDIPSSTTIETGSSTGVLAVCNCAHQSPPDGLFAAGAPDKRGGRDVVLIQRDGTVTNRYGDGTVGVVDRDRSAAGSDDEPFCPDCEQYVRGWLHLDGQDD